MVESIVRNFLKEKLSVEVYMEEPEEIPESYIIIEKTGGGYSNGIKSATIAIQSYAKSLADACLLNEEVKLALEDIDTQNPITKAELNSDYNFTDTETKRYRYQAVFDFLYY